MKSRRNKLAGKHIVPDSEASKSTIYYRNNPEKKKKKAITSKAYNKISVLDREYRNKARKKIEDLTGHKLPPSKDVHHKNDNPLDNKKSNLSVVMAKNNRGDSKKKRQKVKPKKYWNKFKKR